MVLLPGADEKASGVTFLSNVGASLTKAFNRARDVEETRELLERSALDIFIHQNWVRTRNVSRKSPSSSVADCVYVRKLVERDPLYATKRFVTGSVFPDLRSIRGVRKSNQPGNGCGSHFYGSWLNRFLTRWNGPDMLWNSLTL